MTEKGTNLGTLEKCETLAIEGGKPVRTTPLPLEFPGVHHMNEEEEQAVLRVIRSRSLFRYYGVDLQGEVEAFESEIREFLGAPPMLAVNSEIGVISVLLLACAKRIGQEDKMSS